MMYRFISQPNSVIIEVRVDPKAKGQECLQKVCDNLGISNEADYFGLKYENKEGEELWLNIRNPIGNQNRFALRVKFWVPPHLLLQETTRHQFYLHARLDLLQGRLQVTDQAVHAKLIALIAQAELGDHDVAHPRLNFYSHQMHSTTETNSNNNNNNNSGDTSRVTTTTTPNNDGSAIVVSEQLEQQQQALLAQIVNEHRNCRGMKASTAEYWLLKEIATLEGFGEERFHAKQTGGSTMFGVGPHGITIYEKNNDDTITNTPTTPTTIPFTAIQSASSHKRTFRLQYLSSITPAPTTRTLDTKFDSPHLASSLYRAITEKHAFYSCETVGSAVTAQFTRDLKGTIVSIFNEDSSLGKKYVFDISLTCREVYDNARRKLHQVGGGGGRGGGECEVEEGRMEEDGEGCHGDSCNDSNERLIRMIESFTCRICMDQQINTAFVPCGHAVACSACAAMCDRCPLCRADVTVAQKIFLPGVFVG